MSARGSEPASRTAKSALSSSPFFVPLGRRYLWIDAVGEVRGKCRTIAKGKEGLAQLPSWNYDGSSTDQAPGEDSEVIIKPRAVYKVRQWTLPRARAL